MVDDSNEEAEVRCYEELLSITLQYFLIHVAKRCDQMMTGKEIERKRQTRGWLPIINSLNRNFPRSDEVRQQYIYIWYTLKRRSQKDIPFKSMF